MNTYQESDSFISRPQLYGGAGGFSDQDQILPGIDKSHPFFVKGQRQRLNVVPVCQCLLLPWLFFCFIYAVMSFNIHYSSPTVCYTLVGVGGAIVLIAGLYALRAGYRKWRSAREGESVRPPSWLIFLFLSTLAAWMLAIVAGNINFAYNFQPYYDYTNLNVHWGIDPATTSGQELMDAGRLYFVNNSALDLRRSMGFRNLDTYCVAPLTVKSKAGTLEPLGTYDFWAVGLNCCEGNTANFHCGAYDNPNAHQGLRLLRDDQRSYYRLAVQQASASYGIKSNHPLFFSWTADAQAEMNGFRDEGYKYYLVGMLSHFGFQLVCVVLAVYGFVKAGQW